MGASRIYLCNLWVMSSKGVTSSILPFPFSCQLEWEMSGWHSGPCACGWGCRKVLETMIPDVYLAASGCFHLDSYVKQRKKTLSGESHYGCKFLLQRLNPGGPDWSPQPGMVLGRDRGLGDEVKGEAGWDTNETVAKFSWQQNAMPTFWGYVLVAGSVQFSCRVSPQPSLLRL